jgi:hypothetical protein
MIGPRRPMQGISLHEREANNGGKQNHFLRLAADLARRAPELGQTFGQFKDSLPNKPDRTPWKIYLQPLGRIFPGI